MPNQWGQRRPWAAACVERLALTLGAGLTLTTAWALPVSISTPGGSVVVDVGHVGAAGSTVSPSAPQPAAFRPPSLFSAPLPSGSGARALGLSGAFTALADDATAASWNPAGLIQLERPEGSVVWRAGWETDRHTSGDPSFLSDGDSFESRNLNYLSAALPFQVGGRNAVFSLNHQEAYDFTQQFTADQWGKASSRRQRRAESTASQSTVQGVSGDSSVFDGGTIRIDVTSHLTTRTVSLLDELLRSDSVSALEFEQEGTIDAATPALALELTPALSVGAAVNLYRDNTFGGHPIRSRTRAAYSGVSAASAQLVETRQTEGTYTYDGVIQVPPGAVIPVPMEIPISGAGRYEPFSETAARDARRGVRYEGLYEERNAYDDLSGLNATFGALWTVSRHLSLGGALDLPWTAEATQTKTVRNTITTYDAAGERILDVTESEQARTKDVEFRFPLYGALGGVWRWTDVLYSALDVSWTRWSEFAFQAEGEERLNPLDGTPHGEHAIDDCWAVRAGTEYLLVLSRTEIPLRAGVSWEQRPAIGAPDEYWGVSLGTGVSLGKDPGRLILDVAYLYTWGDDVLGSLVPDQPGLGTDVRKHQCFISGIWHF